jgi:hypothetical protein
VLNLTAADKPLLPSTHLNNYIPTVGQPQTDHLRQISRFEQDLLRFTTQPL